MAHAAQDGYSFFSTSGETTVRCSWPNRPSTARAITREAFGHAVTELGLTGPGTIGTHLLRLASMCAKCTTPLVRVCKWHAHNTQTVIKSYHVLSNPVYTLIP
jgi:hypothetical protein